MAWANVSWPDPGRIITAAMWNEQIVQGNPKPIYAPRPTEARCGYCGLYGALGKCTGCGAPNQLTSRRFAAPAAFGKEG